MSLGQGAFEYEGELAACEDPATPESFCSQIIVLTGPKALVEAICSENAGTANVGIRLDDGH